MSNTLLLHKPDLMEMLGGVAQRGRLLAPVRRNKTGVAFERITDSADITLNYVRTILPPKKAFLPPHEPILEFAMGPAPGASAVIENEPFVLFGVHPCDLAGIARLDWVFSRNFEDPHYLARRRAATIVGIECMPDENCFCASVGSDRARDAADLFLTPVGAGYLAEVLTPKGEALLRAAPEVHEPSALELAQAAAWPEEKARRITCRLIVDAAALPDILEEHYNSEVWYRIAQRCSSCGICTMVCPSCACFDVQDEVNFERTVGSRCRVWDSCQFLDFAVVAGPHNFRGERTSRVRHRLLHKFGELQREFGAPLCTGCGRCAEACAAEIGPTDVVGLILAEEKVMVG